MKRLITIKLTRVEADALINAGNRGIADMHDSQDDDQLEAADVADAILDRIGAAASTAWPEAWKESVQ